MGYKKIDQSLKFADLVLASSLKHNRSLKLMGKIDNAINWSRVESILMNHYVVGTSLEGADCLSFKKFLPLPFSKPAPDHSTFSRFRSRLDR